MKRTFLDFLQDIVDSTEEAQGFIEGRNFEAFKEDTRTNFATVRALEIAGEATRHIPNEVRARFHDVPWSNMTAMRDRMIHPYFGEDLRIVWDTVTTDVPQTLPRVRKALEFLEAEEARE